MYQQLIVSTPSDSNRSCSNYRWIELYNRCIWILTDIFRTVLLIATITIFNDSFCNVLILISCGFLASIFLMTHIYQCISNTQSLLSIPSLQSLICGIPMLFIIYVFQHIRFHDYVTHIDRDTQFVGFLPVLGFVKMKTHHITEYILRDNNTTNIKHRIIASNYYILSKMAANKYTEPIFVELSLLIEYIATIHNQNINNNYDKYYDITWSDIRNTIGKNISVKNKVRYVRSYLFGVFVLFASFAMMLTLCLFTIISLNNNWRHLEIINAIYGIYLILEMYIIIIELKHCQFVYYFYHLLTSIQPLQTSLYIDWDDIKINSIDIIYNIMYRYQQINYSLINDCNIHPDISKIICLYLVYKLPENGNIAEIEDIIWDIHHGDTEEQDGSIVIDDKIRL